MIQLMIKVVYSGVWTDAGDPLSAAEYSAFVASLSSHHLSANESNILGIGDVHRLEDIENLDVPGGLWKHRQMRTIAVGEATLYTAQVH
jgi:hypothetical protein